ncbi:MAG: KOW motif-containing protein [Polyangiaceae bacterium]
MGISLGDEVRVVGGAFAGEIGTVVVCDGDQVIVELVLSERPTRMAFDASALTVTARDPRKAFRVELERHYSASAREDTIRWFAERPADEDPDLTDELACLYQIASPLRREYLQVVRELDEAFSEAATASLDAAALEEKWASLRASWLARITPPPLDEGVRLHGLARMESVRAAVPATDDDDLGPSD